MRKITILIAEDHILVRQSFDMILGFNPRFSVVGTCGSGNDAIALSQEMQPDIILMDINLPGINGYDATKEILSISPNSKIICLSMHAQPMMARKMIKAGAAGYVTKNSSCVELERAVVQVYEGKKYICNEIASLMFSEGTSGNNAGNIRLLGKGELSIIDRLKRGFSSREIALEESLSVRTIEARRHNILKKLNLPNVAALINYMNGDNGNIEQECVMATFG